MSRRILLVCAAMLLAGCPKNAPTPTAEPREQQVAVDLFSAVEAWQQTDDAVQWRDATIQRVIADGEAYDVLISADRTADTGEKALLLRVTTNGNVWGVQTVNKTTSDYLWPSN